MKYLVLLILPLSLFSKEITSFWYEPAPGESLTEVLQGFNLISGQSIFSSQEIQKLNKKYNIIISKENPKRFYIEIPTTKEFSNLIVFLNQGSSKFGPGPRTPASKVIKIAKKKEKLPIVYGFTHLPSYNVYDQELTNNSVNVDLKFENLDLFRFRPFLDYSLEKWRIFSEFELNYLRYSDPPLGLTLKDKNLLTLNWLLSGLYPVKKFMLGFGPSFRQDSYFYLQSDNVLRNNSINTYSLHGHFSYRKMTYSNLLFKLDFLAFIKLFSHLGKNFDIKNHNFTEFRLNATISWPRRAFSYFAGLENSYTYHKFTAENPTPAVPHRKVTSITAIVWGLTF